MAWLAMLWMPDMEGHLADRSYVSHLSQDHCEPAEGGHDPRMSGHHRWCRKVTWKMKIGDLEMFGSKTIESWWLHYHIRHLQWRYTPRFLYEVITWYRHVLPISWASENLLIANCTKQKQRCPAVFTFLATSCFQSQEVLSKCRLSFRLFASQGHKRNPSRRSWVASRFLRSPCLDEIALHPWEMFQNEMCDKWLDETCAIEVPIFCFRFLFIATYQAIVCLFVVSF